MSFYLVLPSDASVHQKPNNFVINYDSPIFLTGKWETSLVEYSFNKPITESEHYNVYMQTLSYEEKIVEKYNFYNNKEIFTTRSLDILDNNIEISLKPDKHIEIKCKYQNFKIIFFGITHANSFGFAQDVTSSFTGLIRSDNPIAKDKKLQVMVEIIYTGKNIPKRSNIWFKKYRLPRTLKEISTYFNQYCDSIFSTFIINQNEIVEFELKDNIVHLGMLNVLAHNLGFRNDNVFRTHILYRGYEKPKLAKQINSINIITSIIEPIRVGNKKVPLLRTVWLDQDNEDDDIIHKETDSPMYLPVIATCINNIEVQLCDRFGSLIEFPENSLTNITLHFKKHD